MFYTQGRTFGAPTTGRRKLAVHNENDLTTFNPSGLPSKTPSRAGSSKAQIQLGPATVGRVGLGAKTEGRDRNVLKGQGEGDKRKGKGKDEEIEPKRLFASSSTLPPSKSLSNLPLIPSSRSAPNPSKTPGRPPPSVRKNTLRTPAPPTTFRIAQDISSTPLPSATRRRKSRNSGSGSLSGSGSAGGPGQTPLRPTKDEFKTPAPSAKWEEGDSLGSIEEVGPGVGVELDVLGEEEEESDLELEYMPPRAIELPYEPDWDVEVDIRKEARRANGLPPVMFGLGGLGDIQEIEMKFDNGPDLLKGASEEWLEDPLFRQTPKSIEPLLPKSSTTTISTTVPRKAATIASRPTTIRQPIPPIPSRKVVPKPTITPRPIPSTRTPISVLKPRLANTNIPTTTKVLPKSTVKGKKEDEGVLKAQEELAAQEMTFDFGF